MRRVLIRAWFWVVLVAALGACGGGGGSTAHPSADLPKAPPGDDPVPAPAEPPATPLHPLFEDATLAVGVDVTAPAGQVPGQAGQVYEATGQAWGDVDGDGWIDLYLTRQVGPNVLYRNRGDGTFEPSPHADQVSLPDLRCGGAVFADYDDDGWLDLYVLAWGANKLFRNEQGSGFRDVSDEAGVGDDGRGEAAAWGDYDGDGDLDLYVVNWAYAHSPTPEDPLASRDRLFRNEGDGTFEDVTALLGEEETSGLGFAASFFDYDDDGDLDLYLVNDKGYPGEPVPGATINRNVLWRNDGPGPAGFLFTEVAVAAGADARVDGMGLGIGDIDHDGDEDLFFSDDTSSVLLLNLGDGTFSDVTTVLGLDEFLFGWESLVEDFDLDGHPDLYQAVQYDVDRLWIGDGGTSFTSVETIGGSSTTFGVATGDYDRDGDVDLALCHYDDTYRVYRNLAAESSRDHGWLAIRLEGGDGVDRFAVGTRVTVERTDGLVMTKTVICGSGLGSGNDMTLHFGLGDAHAETVTIRWLDGRVDVRDDAPRNAYWVVSR